MTKLNSGGTGLVYSTYRGGGGGAAGDIGTGIAIQLSGVAYITGITDSVNFPTTTGAFQTTDGG
ncbi:MAG: hypothetical protein ACREUU_10885, partial [Gammaproteobacteria bacterium]